MKLFTRTFFTILFSLFFLETVRAEAQSLDCGRVNGKSIIIYSNERNGDFSARFRHNFLTSDNMVCSGFDIKKLNCIGYIDGTKNLIELITSEDVQGETLVKFAQIRGGTLQGQLTCSEK